MFTYPCPFKVRELHSLSIRGKSEIIFLYRIVELESEGSDYIDDSDFSSESSSEAESSQKLAGDQSDCGRVGSVTETEKSLERQKDFIHSKVSNQLKRKLLEMDNAESKMEFQKDCTEIIANIMGLFYMKKQEKV